MGGVGPGIYTATAIGEGISGELRCHARPSTSTAPIRACSLTLRPPLKLLAQLVLDGAAPPSLAGRRLAFESLSAQSQAARPSVSATNAGGYFAITNLTPGRYVFGGPLFFGASSESVTWSLTSVVLDGADVTDLPITISHDAPPKSVVVTYGDRWQELSGRLTLSVRSPGDGLHDDRVPGEQGLLDSRDRAASARHPQARTASSRCQEPVR